MGAESSSLRAIDSLNETLSNIEYKLGVIEDVHLHHERTICHDNVVLVSGKQIVSNPGVDLVVGPVLGLITQTSVRILIEANMNATLTINFFILDALHTEARFVREEVMTVQEGMPVAKTFSGLLPEKNYAVYIGGCRGQTTIMNYASFATLPRGESLTGPRVLFSHSGRVDRAVPGEVNLWEPMSHIVGKGACGRDAARQAAVNDGDTSHNQTVHMVIHMGNFLQVDNVIRARTIELLDMICREDVSIVAWDAKMRDVEEAVRALYRSAFSSPEIQRTLRRCGHLFLSAEGEAGSLTSSFLGIAPGTGSKGGSANEGPASGADKGKGKATKKKAEANMSFRQQREKAAKEELAKAKSLAKLKRGPLKRGEIDEDTLPVDTEDDLLVPAVGGAIRRTREEIAKDNDLRTQLNEELRILLLGSVLRMLRRVSWAYMRQLWDEDFESLIAQDTQIEENQRAVLKTRKYLQVRLILYSHLEKTRKKLVKEFGEEYKASVDVAQRCKTLANEVEQIESALRAHLTESAMLLARCKEPPNGCAIDAGGIVFILLESCWGWIGKDGLAVTIYNRDVPISAKVSAEVDKLLFEGRGKETPTGDEVRTVICASSSPLIPYTLVPEGAGNKDPYLPQSFTYSAIDVGKLLKAIALWQQRSPERATLMASACPYYAAQGWTFPIINEEDQGKKRKKKLGAEEEEGWNGERCKLRVILVGAMDRQTKAKGESRYAAGESTTPKLPIQDESSGFQVTFDRGSTCSRRCFWNVLSYPSVKPAPKADGSGWIIGVDAGFKLACITDGQEPVHVVVGPVIGRVTSTSAVVLMETSSDCHVELLCVDQVTGVQFTSAKFMTRSKPCYFTFDQLSPGRCYDVRLATHAGYILPARRNAPVPNQGELQVRGSFSTPAFGAWGVYSAEQRDLAVLLRQQAHGLKNLKVSALAPVQAAAAAGGDDMSVAVSQHGSLANSEASRASLSKETKATSPTLRAFIVGANKPSWLRLLPHQDARESDDSALGADRIHLANGLATLQAIADISARSWGPVPLVIHCGYGVDISSVSDGALTLVNRAEEAMRRGETETVAAYLSQALEQLRNAYKLHWGGSSARQLLAHGSHIVVSSPLLDLLHAFNAPSLRQLTRDLTPYAAQTLLSLVTKLHMEYEGSLWDGGLYIPNADGFIRSSNRIHFLAGGSIALFPLQPRPLSAQDNFGTTEDGLLTEYQFDALSNLLGFGEVGSPLNNQEQQLQTLLIASPLPVVHHDPQLLEGTFLSAESHGMCYSPSEVLRLLDMLCWWLEDQPGREVIILTGGVDVGHGTTIVGRQINPQNQFGPEYDVEEEEELEEIAPEVVQSKAQKVLGEGAGSKASKVLGDPPPDQAKAVETPAKPAAASPAKKSGWGMGFGTDKKVAEEVKAVEEKPKGPTRQEIEATKRAEIKAQKVKDRQEKRREHLRQVAMLAQQEANRRANPVSIRQLCIAPLVGVPGSDIPVPEGILVSKERVFSYKHDHIENQPHCGYIEVADNRLNVQLAKEAARKAAADFASAPPYFVVASKLDLVDHQSMRQYVTEDDAVGTNELRAIDAPEKPHDRVIDLSVLKDPAIQEIWRHASAHLSGSRKKRADVPQNQEAMELSAAISTLLYDDTVMALYPFVHKTVFVTGTLPLPLNGGVSVEDTLTAAARILLSNIPREFHELCPMPSSLALRLIWSRLVHAESKMQKKAEAKSVSSATEKLPAPVSTVVASITADAGYLAYYLCQAIEAQALLEHFATILGYNDMEI